MYVKLNSAYYCFERRATNTILIICSYFNKECTIIEKRHNEELMYKGSDYMYKCQQL